MPERTIEWRVRLSNLGKRATALMKRRGASESPWRIRGTRYRCPCAPLRAAMPSQGLLDAMGLLFSLSARASSGLFASALRAFHG